MKSAITKSGRKSSLRWGISTTKRMVTLGNRCQATPVRVNGWDTMDMIYRNTKVMKDTGLLPLQTRESFIQVSKKNLSKDLLKSGLYNKMNLGENLSQILSDTYKNVRIF